MEKSSAKVKPLHVGSDLLLGKARAAMAGAGFRLQFDFRVTYSSGRPPWCMPPPPVSRNA